MRVQQDGTKSSTNTTTATNNMQQAESANSKGERGQEQGGTRPSNNKNTAMIVSARYKLHWAEDVVVRKTVMLCMIDMLVPFLVNNNADLLALQQEQQHSNSKTKYYLSGTWVLLSLDIIRESGVRNRRCQVDLVAECTRRRITVTGGRRQCASARLWQ